MNLKSFSFISSHVSRELISKLDGVGDLPRYEIFQNGLILFLEMNENSSSDLFNLTRLSSYYKSRCR